MRITIASLLLLASTPACTSDDPENGDDGNSTSVSSDASGTATTGPGDSTGLDDSTAPDDSTGLDDSTAPGESTGDDTTGDSGTTGGEVDQLPPADPAAIPAWLSSGEYLGWTGESGVHPSTGPHFGGVRTYVNDALFQSLDAGAAMHPMGAAVVKELYADGDTVRGWSLMVKVQADSAGGNGWYWYELYDDSVLADGTGLGVCTGCHGGGSDYVLSPFPLQ